MILLDTSLIVEVLQAGPRSPEIRKKIYSLPEEESLACSVITYFEILNAGDPDRMKNVPLLDALHYFPVDKEIARRASDIFLSSFQKVRRHIPDTFIAATALTYKIPLWTLDSDFKRIPDLLLF